ncbi:thiolase family protein [Steroidobacter flavus]|uniref:Thiolase family protein n=1 Tax=Steroidobacter flavus TaxID=1842136 RepID=A0ABV8SZ54_9GAMM
MTRKAAIIGTAAIPVGRHQTSAADEFQTLEHELLARLVVQAIADARADRRDVGSIVLAQPRPYTRQQYFSTFMASYLKLPCSGIVMEVLGNGLTAALAFDKAVDEVVLGRSQVALALGVNMETAVSARDHMMESMRKTGDVDFHAPAGFTPISWYALDMMRYMHEFGATRADIAMVAVKNRGHAVSNPLAQFRKPITLEEVLAQRPIVEPLGLYEVPPRGDGAACVVVASEDYAKSLGVPYALVRSRAFFHEGAHQINDRPNDMIAFEAAATATRTAYQSGGITAADIDVAELYAPCTIVEVLASEAAGLVPRGRGAKAAAEGETSLGGRIPIATSGGMTSRGHPSYATPLYNVIELADQLRGRAGERQVPNAQLALLMNELGNYNAALVHVLEAQA